MQKFSAIAGLQALIHPDDLPLVITALKQDRLVWERLQDQSFFDVSSNVCGIVPSLWKPAVLMLIDLNEWQPDIFPVLDLNTPLAGHRKDEAAVFYEAVIHQQKPPVNLSETGLLALAMRERRRQTHTWDWLAEELLPAGDIQLEQWKSPLACLYGLLPDPVEMLHSLVNPNFPIELIPVINHILFSNQVAQVDQAAIYMELAGHLKVSSRSQLVQGLASLGQVALASSLAKTFEKETTPNEQKTLPGGILEKEDAVHQALDLEQLASLYYHAGDHQHSLQILQKAQETVNHWMDELQGKIFASASKASPEEPSRLIFDRLRSRSVSPAYLQNDLALGFKQYPEIHELLEKIPAQTLSPLVRIQQAGWASESGNPSNGRRIAAEAMQNLAHKLGTEKDRPIHLYGADWNPIQLVEILKNLGMTAEAFHLAILSLQVNPGDAIMASECSSLLASQGDYEQALEYARLSTALEPHNPVRRRSLASILEQTGDWDAAWKEREKVIELDPLTSAADFVFAGRAALHLENWDSAIEQAGLALKLDENDGHAYTLMGQAYLNKGETVEAVNKFSRATLLIPEEAEPWLMLADAYKSQGENQQALEVLRTATLAAPESAEVNYRLGKACLDQGLTSEALIFLKQASKLNPSSLMVGFELGKTLHDLGYTAEAAQVFEETRKKWPLNPELAYAQAQTLLSLGKPDLALIALEAAVNTPSPKFEWLCLHARTLLGNDSLILRDPQTISPAHLVNAHQSLEKALALQPDSFPERLLLAEILTLNGNLEASLSIYKEIADLAPSGANEWHWRLQAGLGKTALLLKMAPAAIAALQEAVQARPDDIRLIRLMVEALILANLRQEAVQTARFALKLAPADIHNLAWFATTMVHLNEEREALNALQCASQLDPGSPSHFVELAGLQLKLGDLGSARDTLDRFRSLPGITSSQYRQAAYTYLRLEDPSSAAGCLEHALGEYDDPPVSLLLETGCIYHRINKDDLALGMIQKAIQYAPDRAHLYVFQSDLLSILNRIQAALASLEQAQKLLTAENPNQIADFELMGALMPQNWLSSLLDPASIDARFALLLRRTSDYPSAYHHAQSAFNKQPASGFYCYLFSELGLSMNQPEDARKVLNNLDQTDGPLSAELLCLQAEMKLNQGEEILAGKIAGICVSLAPQTSRTLALQARLLALKGDWKEAGECFQQAWDLFQALPTQVNNSSFGLHVNLMQEKGLWLAETALAVHRYRVALELLEQYVNENSKEPRAHLAYGRGLVICAEQERTHSVLRVHRHSPGSDKLTEACQNRFESALLTAGKMNRTAEVNRWLARGRAAFKPIPQHVRPLVNITPDVEDTAALIAVLRQINNPNVAMQMAGQYPHNLYVQLQLALCLRKNDPLKALEIAHENSGNHPSNPLAKAALSLTAEAAGLTDQALESLEQALEIWPDEPEWHAWAARLAAEQADDQVELSHLKAACTLEPDQIDFAAALARKYFDIQDYPSALEILNKAVIHDPLNVNLWLLLARVNLEKGQMEEALANAQKANDLEQNSIAPLILCGEIYLRLGKVNDALEYANYAANRSPHDDQAVLFLTRILSEKGKSAEVLKILEEAIRTGHSSKDVRLEQARYILRFKGSQSAQPLLAELAADYQDDPQVLTLLSQTQADCGDLAAAEANAAAALRINPKIPGLNLFIGKLKRQSGQLDQAIHYLSSNIQQFPLDAEAYIELGHTHEERREYLQALKAYQQAIRHLPNDYRPYLEAAVIMKESKDYVGAEAMLRRAAELNPADVNIRRQLAGVITLNLVHNARKAETNK